MNGVGQTGAQERGHFCHPEFAPCHVLEKLVTV